MLHEKSENGKTFVDAWLSNFSAEKYDLNLFRNRKIFSTTVLPSLTGENISAVAPTMGQYLLMQCF